MEEVSVDCLPKAKYFLHATLSSGQTVSPPVSESFSDSVAQIILATKIFLHDLCRLNVDWNELFPSDLNDEWFRFILVLSACHVRKHHRYTAARIFGCICLSSVGRSS